MKSGYIATIALSSLIALGACGKKQTENKIQDEKIPVTIMNLNQESLNGKVHASGQFTTDDETYLSFKTGGIIEKIFAKEGDQVQEGQLLATLNLTEIKAMVDQAEIAVAKAKRDYQRVLNLYKDSVATLEQLQNTQSMLELSQQQLLAAGFNFKHSEIRAVKSGYVLKRLAQQGQIVGAGTPVFLVNGGVSGQWVLRVAVSDKQWAGIKTGDTASVEVPSLGISNTRGTVVRKAEMADPYTGTFSIHIQVSPREGKFASGMVGKAIITSSRRNTVWELPYEAVLDANANEAFVFITRDGKKAERVKVKVSSIGEKSVWVEQGLEGIAQLIVRGNAYLRNGSDIIINQQ